MRTIQIAPTASGDVTDETLKLGPPRLLTFLQGVSDPAIRTLFAPLGWSDQRLDEAWSLLNELKAASKIPATPVPDPVTEGIASCEAWQATGLIRARAMMQLAFPEQAAFMFHDFVAGTGTEAVLKSRRFSSAVRSSRTVSSERAPARPITRRSSSSRTPASPRRC